MNTRKGFTLVELLVVIAILAILATVSVVGYTAFIEGADEQAVITEAEQVKGTINAGLTYRECVVITDKDGATHVSLAADGKYVVSTTCANDKSCHDAAADCKVPGDLTVDTNGVLYYENNDVKVKLSDLSVVK